MITNAYTDYNKERIIEEQGKFFRELNAWKKLLVERIVCSGQCNLKIEPLALDGK